MTANPAAPLGMVMVLDPLFRASWALYCTAEHATEKGPMGWVAVPGVPSCCPWRVN
jgi:hypothetical protein